MLYQFAVYFCCLYAFFINLCNTSFHLFCFSFSYLRFLYLRHVCLCWLHLCHTSPLNYILAFSIPMHPPPMSPTLLRLSPLSVTPSFIPAAIPPHTSPPCHSPVSPVPTLTRAILHQIVSLTLELNVCFFVLFWSVIEGGEGLTK